MTTTAQTRAAWTSSVPASSNPAAPSHTAGYASSVDTPPFNSYTPSQLPPSHHPPLTNPDEDTANNDLDQKMAEFRQYLASRSAGAGPDFIMNVLEYGTFLPRPYGCKERSHEKSPSSSAPGNVGNSNDWALPNSPPRTISGYAAGCGPPLQR